MRHGVFAASNRPWGSVIGVPTTTLAYSCSNSRCRCWRVGKSLNTRTIILSTKGSLAALQLRGVEHGGRDWMWQGILATGVGPWCGIIGVKLTSVGVGQTTAACSVCLTSVLGSATRCLIIVARRIAICLMNTARCRPWLRVISE